MKLRLPKNRYLRTAVWLGASAGSFLLVVCAVRWAIARQSAAELRAEVERLNADDPGWDWNGIQSARAPVADAVNGYSVIAGLDSRPASSNLWFEPEMRRWRVLPEPLPTAVAEWAGEFVVDREAAIRTARKLVAFPDGRHPIAYSANPNEMRYGTLHSVDSARTALTWDIRVSAHLGRFDTCIGDLRALRNAGRTFGDEPLVLANHIRMGCGQAAAALVGEVFSQGVPPAAGLALLQAELLEESREPLLERALRGQRAFDFEEMRFLAGYDHTNGSNLHYLDYRGNESPNPTSWSKVAWLYRPFAEADQAFRLRRINEDIAVARLRGPECVARTAELRKFRTADERQEYDRLLPHYGHFLTRRIGYDYTYITGVEMHWKAAIRSAATGIAAERFRMDNRRWPTTFDELVPKYMDRVESDPYTDGPLILKRLPDGIVIYSVGQNATDDGGDVNGVSLSGGFERGDFSAISPTDVGMRLWDVEKRGK